MVGWYYRLNGHAFEQALVDGDGQGAWRAAVHGVTERQGLGLRPGIGRSGAWQDLLEEKTWGAQGAGGPGQHGATLAHGRGPSWSREALTPGIKPI